jgi:hypothetical protein
MMQIIFGIQQVAVPKYGDIFENRLSNQSHLIFLIFLIKK